MVCNARLSPLLRMLGGHLMRLPALRPLASVSFRALQRDVLLLPTGGLRCRQGLTSWWRSYGPHWPARAACRILLTGSCSRLGRQSTSCRVWMRSAQSCAVSVSVLTSFATLWAQGHSLPPTTVWLGCCTWPGPLRPSRRWTVSGKIMPWLLKWTAPLTEHVRWRRETKAFLRSPTIVVGDA